MKRKLIIFYHLFSSSSFFLYFQRFFFWLRKTKQWWLSSSSSCLELFKQQEKKNNNNNKQTLKIIIIYILFKMANVCNNSYRCSNDFFCSGWSLFHWLLIFQIAEIIIIISKKISFFLCYIRFNINFLLSFKEIFFLNIGFKLETWGLTIHDKTGYTITHTHTYKPDDLLGFFPDVIYNFGYFFLVCLTIHDSIGY